MPDDVHISKRHKIAQRLVDAICNHSDARARIITKSSLVSTVTTQAELERAIEDLFDYIDGDR